MRVRVSTWRFFLENAGYCIPPGRAMCALQLLRGHPKPANEGHLKTGQR